MRAVVPRSLLFVLGLVMCLPVAAEIHTFTNVDGRTLDAELADTTVSKAVLKVSNGALVKVDLSSFSPADRQYIAAWSEEQKRQKPPVVTVVLRKNPGPSTTDKSGVNVTTNSPVRYEVTVRNLSNRPVENVSIDLSFEIETALSGGSSNSKSSVDTNRDQLFIQRLETAEAAVLQTKEIDLVKSVKYTEIRHVESDGRRTIELRASKSYMRVKSSSVVVKVDNKVIWKS